MKPAVDVKAAVGALRAGGVIACPTEAVWGLSCAPDNDEALAHLMRIKARDPAKSQATASLPALAAKSLAVHRDLWNLSEAIPRRVCSSLHPLLLCEPYPIGHQHRWRLMPQLAGRVPSEGPVCGIVNAHGFTAKRQVTRIVLDRILSSLDSLTRAPFAFCHLPGHTAS